VRLAKPTLLLAKLGSLAERPSVGLLPDEGDPARAQFVRKRGQPLGRAGEVGAAEVA
jgi:hypothetical protein